MHSDSIESINYTLNTDQVKMSKYGADTLVLVWGRETGVLHTVTHPPSIQHYRATLNCATIKKTLKFSSSMLGASATAVQLVFNPFSQLVPQLELYSQLQLSL